MLCQHPDCVRLTADGAIITPQKLNFNGDLAKRPRLFKGEVKVQLARKATGSLLGTLAILPNELLIKIVRALEEDAHVLHYQRVQEFGLVCLALTSTDFYKICKCVHPAPLPTTRGDGIRDENKNFWAWSLERHIGEFLGPVYQVRERDARYGFYTRNGSPFVLKGGESDKVAVNKDDAW